MAVPTTMQDLSTTAASNSPGDTENPISMDDFFRAVQSILRHTQAKGADIASATTTNLVTATGLFVDVTGTTTITGLGTVAAGIIRIIRFTGALTLTHNATSLILPGAANITTAANDRAMFISLGSGNWLCFIYVKADGTSVGGVTDASITQAKLAAALRLQFNLIQDFRLTLTTGVPVTTADVTAATTIYCTPYKGNVIALYDGTNWNLRTSAEFSLALGTLTSGKPYDIFCYDNAGTPTLEFLVWTNDTTRATALTYQDGVLVKTGATTRRYLGTFYTTSTTQTEDSAAKRYLWNYYHRIPKALFKSDATVSWTYTTATFRQARADATNQVEFICGLAEDAVSLRCSANFANSGGGITAYAGMGLDGTTELSSGGYIREGMTSPGTNLACTSSSTLNSTFLGRHFVTWLEYSVATGTTTWTSNGFSAGIRGSILC